MKTITNEELNERLTTKGEAKSIVYEHIRGVINLTSAQLDKCLKVKTADENRI